MRTSIFKQFRPLISSSLVLLATALVLSSCSKKPQQQIIGKWQVQGKPAVVEFRKDGTVVTTEDAKESLSKYKFVDDSHIEMEMSAPAGTNKLFIRLTFSVAIHDDTAELSMNVSPNSAAPPKIHTMRLNRTK